MRIFIGNDLGQASDYTALTVVVEDDGIYHLRYLDRFRGIPYPSIVERVATLVRRLTAKNGRAAGCDRQRVVFTRLTMQIDR